MKGFCPINYISRLHPAVFIEAIKITAGEGRVICERDFQFLVWMIVWKILTAAFLKLKMIS